jgi:hypothetical protein
MAPSFQRTGATTVGEVENHRSAARGVAAVVKVDPSKAAHGRRSLPTAEPVVRDRALSSKMRTDKLCQT